MEQVTRDLYRAGMRLFNAADDIDRKFHLLLDHSEEDIQLFRDAIEDWYRVKELAISEYGLNNLEGVGE